MRRTRPRRQIDVKLLLASLAIAFGLVLVGFALLRAETGSDTDDLPDAIEQIEPVNRATQVFAGSQVSVDLEAGYEGLLVIDGTELETVRTEDLLREDPDPGEQVSIPTGVVIYDEGRATLTYTPGPDAPVEEFAEGPHSVTVRFWKIEEGPQRARIFSWSFDAV